jgi:hypothetical protein
MCWLIRWEMPAEKAVICSWMHMRKVSEDQRPCLRMVSRSSPFSFIAMALPAHSEWLLTRSTVKPQRCNLSARAADFAAVLMCEESTCRVRPCAQQAERGVSRSVVKARMSETHLAREQTGQWEAWMASSWMTAPFVPFFWLGRVRVAGSASSRD